MSALSPQCWVLASQIGKENSDYGTECSVVILSGLEGFESMYRPSTFDMPVSTSPARWLKGPGQRVHCVLFGRAATESHVLELQESDIATMFCHPRIQAKIWHFGFQGPQRLSHQQDYSSVSLGFTSAASTMMQQKGPDDSRGRRILEPSMSILTRRRQWPPKDSDGLALGRTQHSKRRPNLYQSTTLEVPACRNRCVAWPIFSPRPARHIWISQIVVRDWKGSDSDDQPPRGGGAPCYWIFIVRDQNNSIEQFDLLMAQRQEHETGRSHDHVVRGPTRIVPCRALDL